jgi:hypothetical protein
MQKTLLAAAIFSSGILQAQQMVPFRATITGGGSREEGKCTIEVNVDSLAEVEVRGDTAYLRTLQGQPSEWRRFQCNVPMPVNPNGLRFVGVDGRGRQQLVSNGRGAIVVRIEDRDNGREGYTFDLIWRNDGAYYGGPGYPSGPGPYGNERPNGPVGGVIPPPVYQPGRPGDENRPFDRDGDRDRRGFDTGDAIRACQDAVGDRAFDRFRARPFSFRDVHLELMGDPRYYRTIGNVIGMVDLARGRYDEWYRFTCTVDMEQRRVGRVDFDRFRDRR